MRSPRRHALLVPALLCALAVLAAGSTAAIGDDVDSGGSGGSRGAGAEVARLLQETSVATHQYEEGRREAEAQRAKARRLERLLARERRNIDVLRDELGRIARAQYRSGGSLPQAAQMLLAESPEDLMRGQHALWQADLALNNTVIKSRRAETQLAADEAKASAAWQALERRNARLAEMKRGIERKLEAAQWTLQGRAEASVAAGSCRGAVRLGQRKRKSFTRAWVAPVETYELSAGFGSGGAYWANGHTGQDFAVDIGTPVRSVGEGRVVKVSCGGAFGVEVVVRHPNGYYTQYAHLSAVAVDQGERVAPGQWVGQSGTTGNSTGPHLHFEVRLTPYLGSGVDPLEWLAEHGVRL
ncbi:M23 family metallopeptidase [Streptomyces sporangiiformans]|uniref:M23 family metallopeptidase n=1 Tax=Streptomyces sporangiiformans TaxID=2315329 RepID=A0A505D1Q8_9ACTN|nr:M23 family metallopeptidase [Streptomyces sporangiiformans]TPQ16112.1 M23 family metallopeptidase [Streptomyces sporangiiformans]